MINRIERMNQLIQVDPEFGGRFSSGNRTSVEGEQRQDSRPPGMAAPGKSFSDMLNTSIDEVNRNQLDADQAIKDLVAGRTKNVHETLLAVERADASLKLMVQVRNKILDAYREIMRMQV